MLRPTEAPYFRSIQEGLGTYGLCGLDRLFSFMIVRELQQFIRIVRGSIVQSNEWLSLLSEFTQRITPHRRVVGE